MTEPGPDNTIDGEGSRAARSHSPLRTLKSIIGFLVFFTLVAFSIAVIATAPWMRISPDCSVVCVFANDLMDLF